MSPRSLIVSLSRKELTDMTQTQIQKEKATALVAVARAHLQQNEPASLARLLKALRAYKKTIGGKLHDETRRAWQGFKTGTGEGAAKSLNTLIGLLTVQHGLQITTFAPPLDRPTSGDDDVDDED